jgi:hypothetical protein
MGRVNSQVIARLIRLNGFIRVLDIREETANGAFDFCVSSQLVGNIYKGKVKASAFGEGVVLMVKAVCFAHAAAHGYAVNGMAKAALGDGYKECYRRVRVAMIILHPDCAQRIAQCTTSIAIAAKEAVDGDSRAKFFFLI